MRAVFLTSLIAILFVSLFALTPAQAGPEFFADVAKQGQAAGRDQGAGFGTPRDPRETAALLIRGVLTLVGTIFVGYTIYAGVIILTAGGDSSKVDKGKSTLRSAILGVVITLSAYTIVTFISITVISSATDRQGYSSSDFNTLLNPWEWLKGIRGDGDSGLGQRRYENNDPLNQPAITPFDSGTVPWER